MALAQNYIRMYTGASSWFDTPAEKKNNTPPIDGDGYHQVALQKLKKITLERTEVVSLNDRIAKVKHDTEQEIMQINAKLLAKIQNLSDVRDLEVAELQEKADALTAHIQKSSHAGPRVIAEPVHEKYAVNLNM